MQFKDRLKQAREKAGITQSTLATLSGISERVLLNYELGSKKPRQIEIIENLAAAINIPVNDLIDNADVYVIEAYKKGGAKAAREVDELLSDLTDPSASDEYKLTDADRNTLMAILYEAYWIAKEKNKKYTPNKYKKDSDTK